MALREELWPHLLQPRPDEARPDLASPLAGTWTKSAAGIWIPGAPNAITGKPWVSGGSGAEPTVAGTSAGLGIYTSGKWIQTDLPSASFSALTWTAVICPDAAPSSTGFNAFFQTGQTTFNWNHASTSYQGAFSLYNSGGYPTCKFTGGFTAGKTEVIGGTYDGTTLVVYRAGVFENSQTAANGLSGVPLNSLQLLGGTGGTVAWAGSMPFFLWDTGRAYSAAEMAVLHANVWQVFAPRRIWVPVSAGGSSLDLTQTTAVALSGSVSVSGDVQIGTNFNLTQSSAVGLTGSLATTGDVQIGIIFNLAQTAAVGLAGSVGVSGDIQILSGSLDLTQTSAVAMSGTVGLSGDIQIGTTFDLAQTAAVGLTGSVATTGNIQIGTNFNLAQSAALAMSGSVAVSGDLQAGTAPVVTQAYGNFGWDPRIRPSWKRKELREELEAALDDAPKAVRELVRAPDPDISEVPVREALEVVRQARKHRERAVTRQEINELREALETVATFTREREAARQARRRKQQHLLLLS